MEMKKIVLILGLCLVFSMPAQADDSVDSIAQNIYDECNSNILSVSETQVIKGNIEDVKRERSLRKCLKDKIVEISHVFMKKEEVNNFEESLNQLENTSFLLYKSLIFCGADSNDNWCDIRPNDDKSLGKLILEKQITAQIYHILQDIINAKQGGYNF